MMRKAMMSALVIEGVALLLLVTAARAQPTPPGDSYLCYAAGLASGQPKFTPVQKSLEDQFGAVLVDVKGIVTLCNPAQTAVHPTVHGVGYKFSTAKTPPQPKFPMQNHTAFDQFGTHPFLVARPMEVRAPSAKVPGSGGTGPVDTTGVDHFECYKAIPASGAPKFVPPPPVAITDQFGTQSYTLTKITKLCTPVNKNGEDPMAPQRVGHLVCYQARLPRGSRFTPRTVSVNNTNFGPAVLVARSVREFCVPAFKDAVPTSSTTTTTTTTASSTTASSTSTTTTTASSTTASSTTTTVSSTTTTTTPGPIPFCTTTGGPCIGFTPGTGPCVCEGYVDGSGNVCVKPTPEGAPCTSSSQCPPDAMGRYVCAEAPDGPKRCRLVCE